jgi:hypothetical protein
VHVLEPRFSARHTFQAFGNSEKLPRNKSLRGALAVEWPRGVSSMVRAARRCKGEKVTQNL